MTGVLKTVIEACKEGASARSICELGDKMILEETGKVYKKEKEVKKGMLCVNHNHNYIYTVREKL